MSFFTKLAEQIGIVETLDGDDDEYTDDLYQDNAQQGQGNFSNSSNSFASFSGNDQMPQTKQDRTNPWDINPGKSFKSNTKITSYNTSDQIKMIVINPDNYDEAREICDYIKSGKPVVVNLENMQFETAQRVMDFLSGSCYSLNGNVQRVAKNIFIVAPNNIDVSADYKSQQAKTTNLPWMTSGMNTKSNTMDMRP